MYPQDIDNKSGKEELLLQLNVQPEVILTVKASFLGAMILEIEVSTIMLRVQLSDSSPGNELNPSPVDR